MDALWLLISCTWKAAVIVALGAAFNRFWPRTSATERRAAWAMVVAALLALPLLSLTWSVVPALAWLDAASPSNALAAPDGRTVITVVAGEEHAPALGWWIPLGWAAGALYFLARSLMGHIRAHEYFRNAISLPRIEDLGEWHYPILCSSRVPAPMVAGAWRPHILLPADAMEWDLAQLRRVLAHEAEHIRHHDPLWKLLSSIVVAAYWFHPLVRLASSTFESERERACDDAVLREGHQPSHYATDLVAFAKNSLARQIPEGAIPMASPARLELRIVAILDSNTPRRTLRRNTMLTYTLALALLLLPLSAVQSMAQSGAPNNLSTEIRASLDRIRATALNAPATAFESVAANHVNKVTPPASNNDDSTMRLPSNELRGNRADSQRTIASASTPEAQGQPVAQSDTPPSRIRVGGKVQEQKLVKRVQPTYPPSAKAEGVQGTVRLKVRINKEGYVAEVEVETSPDDRLSESAKTAVSQWIYEPTLLNGNPVEVLTVVDVNYTLKK